MAEDDLIIGVGANTVSAKASLNELRKFIKQVQKDVETPLNLSLSSGKDFQRVQQELKDLDKIRRDLRSPSSGGVSASAFTSIYGQSKAQATRSIKEQEQIFQNSLVSQIEKASSFQSQLSAITDRRIQKEAEAAKQMEYLNRNIDVSMPSLRYALYDVSNSLGVIGNQLQQTAIQVVNYAKDYETAFTQVERTTLASGQSLENIRSQLIQLSTQVPVSFQELADLASLGAQLGVADENIAAFSETVAKFAAVTNVSTQSAAQGFGALGELLNVSANQYNNLGSAIANVGVESVATESEIFAVATAIGGVANSAGLSADYVVGLSGSLASLRIPAEQSRGALTRIFQEINRSAAGSGVDMQLFANVLGVTAEEANRLATSDMEGFFNKFVQGLSRVDQVSLTGILDQLNLSDIRVTNTLTRLSRNSELVAETMKISNSAFEEGSFLNDTYALKVDDLASGLQILNNSFANLVATMGKELFPIIKPIILGLTQILVQLNNLADTPAGKSFLAIAGIAGGLVFVLARLAQFTALATASFGALSFSIKTLGWDVQTRGIGMYISSLFGLNVATNTATASLNRFKVALVGTGIGAAVLLLGTLAAAFMQAGDAAYEANQDFTGSTSGLAEAISEDTANAIKASADGNYELANSYTAISSSVTDASGASSNAQSTFDSTTDAIKEQTQYIGENTAAWFQNALAQDQDFMKIAGDQRFSDTFNDIGADFNKIIQIQASQGEDGVRNYFRRIARTALVEGSITARQFAQIQNAIFDETGRSGTFGSIPQFDSYIKKINQYGNAFSVVSSGAKSAAKELDNNTEATDSNGNAAGKAAEKIRTLSQYASDLEDVFSRAFDIRFSANQTLDKITESFSKIAQATADARLEIQELNAQISDLNADRALQEYFLSVAEAYGDTLKAQEIRANLAKIDADLAKKTKDLGKAQDKTNKTLVGNSDAAIDNRSEILGLVKAYQSHIKSLADSGASQETLSSQTELLREDFIRQATALGYAETEVSQYAKSFDDVAAAIKNVPRNVTVDFNGDPTLLAIQEFAAKSREAIAGAGGTVGVSTSFDDEGLEAFKREFKKAADGTWDLYINGKKQTAFMKLAARPFADGGYVTGPGTGTSDSIPANLSNGEYVVRASAVSKYGVGFFDQLNQMRAPQYFSGSAPTSSGASMVSLSPEDRALLRNIGGSGEVVLYANNEAIARSANAGNKQIVASGGRP